MGGSFWYFNDSGQQGITSDERMKTDIQNLEEEDISFLMRLTPKKYKLKNTQKDCFSYGLVAQSVFHEATSIHQKAIVNNFEIYEKNQECEEMLGLCYDSFIPLCFQAIKNHETKIANFKEEKTLISDKLDTIKSLVTENNNLDVSENKELLLHSDAIYAIENMEVYKDGIDSEQNKDEVILNLLSVNQYLIKELAKIKMYLKNL